MPATALLSHLRRARDLIDRAYAEDLDLDALARAAGYSRYHFARSFREVYGETPARYLTSRRIERAKDLLRATTLSVTEICHLVGFSSLGSFSARFSAMTGMSPTEYRKRFDPPPVPGCFVLMWARTPFRRAPRSGEPVPEGREPRARQGRSGGPQSGISTGE